MREFWQNRKTPYIMKATCFAFLTILLFASSNLSSYINAQTFLDLPVPCGKLTVHLICWSLYYGFAFLKICNSTDKANLVYDDFFANSIAFLLGLIKALSSMPLE